MMTSLRMSIETKYHASREQIIAEEAEIEAAKGNPNKFAPLYNRYYARILGFVYHKANKKDIFQRDIEEEFEIRRSSVTSVLQLMERNGHIERVSVSTDARLKKITLTEKGKEIQRNVRNLILEFEKSLTDELSDEELDILVSLIDRLSNRIAD